MAEGLEAALGMWVEEDGGSEGLILNFDSGSWYLGAYLGPRDQLEAVEAPQTG